MSPLVEILLSLTSKISGNRAVQKILEKNILVSQYLMGVGSGAGVKKSGEEVIFKYLSEHVNPPYCILDIGANKGQFLDLALRKISNKDFSIHCFEPGKETFKELNNRDPDSRIILNNIGIGKERGELTLYYNTPGSGLASLTKRNLSHIGVDFNESEVVEIDTIDEYCTNNFIDRINLLKVDIEGHELDAFAGAKKMFDRKAIDIVTFEFGGCNIDTRTFFRDFWYFVNENDMRLFRITPSGYLFPIDSYREANEQFRTANFIAMRNKKDL